MGHYLPSDQPQFYIFALNYEPTQHQVSSFHYSSKPPLYQASCKTQLTYMIIFLKFNLKEYFHLFIFLI